MPPRKKKRFEKKVRLYRAVTFEKTYAAPRRKEVEKNYENILIKSRVRIKKETN